MTNIFLNYRQKALIGLLQAFGGHLANTDFQKYLFLFTKEYEKEPSFEFVPYKFGGFSFQSYADKRRLIEVGVLVDSNDWQLNEDFLSKNVTELKDFHECYQKYCNLKRIAITCFEAHVCMCHRGRVATAIAALPGWKYDVCHI